MSFKDRIIGAAKLNLNVYKEVGSDNGATSQAVLIVALSGLATGLGGIYRGGISGIFLVIIACLAGWYLCALITYYIGTKLLPESETSTDIGELLRIIGFASVPSLIRVLGIIPHVETLAFFVSSIWILIAIVMAVKQSLQYKSTIKTIGICFIGWLVQALIVELALIIA